MVNKYYQKHKERYQKESRERYQNIKILKTEKGRKKAREKYQNFNEEENEKWCPYYQEHNKSYLNIK